MSAYRSRAKVPPDEPTRDSGSHSSPIQLGEGISALTALVDLYRGDLLEGLVVREAPEIDE